MLQDADSITNAAMEEKVIEIYDVFNRKRRACDAEEADLMDLEELNKKIKGKKKK